MPARATTAIDAATASAAGWRRRGNPGTIGRDGFGAGAGADPAVNRLWHTQLHLMFAALAIAINILCAAGEYQHIRAQGQLMDYAIERVNRPRAADGSALS